MINESFNLQTDVMVDDAQFIFFFKCLFLGGRNGSQTSSPDERKVLGWLVRFEILMKLAAAYTSRRIGTGVILHNRII